MGSLYHSGTKGMKWGVRRYQNADGTWTDLGKERRRGYRVKTLTDKELAQRLYSKAKKAEPKITKDVTSAAFRAGSRMYGLENKLKTEQSLARKIRTDALEGDISKSEAASNIKDSVRYTTISTDDDFVDNYNSFKKDLERKGYEEIRCRNYWDLYNKGQVKHKSVQSVFKSPSNDIFEVQFQTPSSQAAKDKKVPLYEEARQPGISQSRKAELVRQMEELAETVADPADIYRIRSH